MSLDSSPFESQPPSRHGSGRSHAELIVHSGEISGGLEERFLAKLEGTLATRPQAVILNLIASRNLESGAVQTLLKARNLAKGYGVRLAVRPTTPSTRGYLESIGMGSLLELRDPEEV